MKSGGTTLQFVKRVELFVTRADHTDLTVAEDHGPVLVQFVLFLLLLFE